VWPVADALPLLCAPCASLGGEADALGPMRPGGGVVDALGPWWQPGGVADALGSGLQPKGVYDWPNLSFSVNVSHAIFEIVSLLKSIVTQRNWNGPIGETVRLVKWNCAGQDVRNVEIDQIGRRRSWFPKPLDWINRSITAKASEAGVLAKCNRLCKVVRKFPLDKHELVGLGIKNSRLPEWKLFVSGSKTVHLVEH